jgi:acid phosphatase
VAYLTQRGHGLTRRWFPSSKGSIGAAIALSATLSVIAGIANVSSAATIDTASSYATATPIKHLIVIIGENHSFDNVFGTYVPPKGQTIWNLLSEGIINPDGSPGPNYRKAEQWQALDTSTYSIAPKHTTPYLYLPQPNTTYARYQPPNAADSRFPARLPNGPFPITQYIPYTQAYVGDPVHRFFQMWQQYDDGKMDLYTWVANTIGIGSQNGPSGPKPGQTYQGAVQMGFYNMQTGDAPKFYFLARHYAISDNYHQTIMGGTGANFFAIGTADVAFYNKDGVPATPPSNQIENPNPKPGTNNWYTQDGYQGGSYVECSNPSQPGVKAILDYLHSLPYKPFRGGDCAPNTYYLVNNYNPGYLPSGSPAPLGPNKFVVPPQSVPSIGDALSAKGISWAWFIGGWNDGNPTYQFCAICDPFAFLKSIMTTPLRSNIQGMTQFYDDVASGTLPAVSFVRPYESDAGHPADSNLSDFENFVSQVINAVHNQPSLWKSTAILITTDESGGYYDSGYIQTIDFFGDGPRVPFIVVSPWAKNGYVDHTYYDHTSILKFIERNWGLKPLSNRSMDNLPNPIPSADNPYVPANRPAVGDLMNLFDFHHYRASAPSVP